MALWKNDEELFRLMRAELFTALVGDLLDRNGYLKQFLPPDIKPLDPGMIVIGRAMPVLEQDLEASMDNGRSAPPPKPFGRMFEALDSLKANEVYICSGASPTYALWGGLMSTRARYLGATGAIVNGYSRDTTEILRLDFPTFSLGGYAQDQGPRGHVIDFACPIQFGQVTVHPGDLVFGDRDGVVIVPAEAEKDALEGALEKARGEQLVRQSIVNGMSTVDAFNSYGIM